MAKIMPLIFLYNSYNIAQKYLFVKKVMFVRNVLS